MTERIGIPRDDYYGALLEALRNGDDYQADHLIRDYTLRDGQAFPRRDLVRRERLVLVYGGKHV